MTSKADIESFVAAWVARNVRSAVAGNVLSVVDGLAAGLTGDARAQGISGRELHGALGDIDEYLTRAYQRVCACEPPAGPDSTGSA